MSDLLPNVNGLLTSNASDAYFIIGILGTPDFIQLYGSEGTAFLDFPMITARQMELRPVIEAACLDLGLTLTINTAPNGAEFLDYELPAIGRDIANILRTLLIRVYGATDDTSLEFEANGFDLSAT
jgi:hypothetical protein